MANSRYYQFLFSKTPMLTMLQGQFVVGSTGAVSSSSGTGLKTVVRLTTGIYQLQAIDDFNAFVGADFTFQSGVTGGNVSDGSLSANSLYQITAVGTTDWAANGLATGLTATVGQSFVATTSGGAGTGTAKLVTTSGISSIEVAQNPQVMLVNSVANSGAIVNIQTLDAAGALANPTSGAIIAYQLYFRNSSVAY